jgi:hypothetical protein
MGIWPGRIDPYELIGKAPGGAAESIPPLLSRRGQIKACGDFHFRPATVRRIVDHADAMEEMSDAHRSPDRGIQI